MSLLRRGLRATALDLSRSLRSVFGRVAPEDRPPRTDSYSSRSDSRHGKALVRRRPLSPDEHRRAVCALRARPRPSGPRAGCCLACHAQSTEHVSLHPGAGNDKSRHRSPRPHNSVRRRSGTRLPTDAAFCCKSVGVSSRRALAADCGCVGIATARDVGRDHTSWEMSPLSRFEVPLGRTPSGGSQFGRCTDSCRAHTGTTT